MVEATTYFQVYNPNSWWHPINGFQWGHPTSFPAKEGETIPVGARAIVTKEVPCHTCNANPGEDCTWEPHRDISPDRLHRFRLKLITESN